MQAQAGDKRDCALCPKPEELFPDNIPAYQIYLIVRNQFIVAGLGEVIGINQSSVLETIKLYIADEEERKDVFEKVLYLSQFDMNELAKAREKMPKK